MAAACFFAGWPGAGPCDGRLVRAHLIPKQLIRREVISARSKDPSGGRWPVDTAQRAELARILWDERVIVPVCGGPMGLSGHHGALDAARTLRIPRERLPVAVAEFAEEFGLTWWLDREYGLVPAPAPQCANPYCHDGWVARGDNESRGAPALPCRACGCALGEPTRGAA